MASKSDKAGAGGKGNVVVSAILGVGALAVLAAVLHYESHDLGKAAGMTAPAKLAAAQKLKADQEAELTGAPEWDDKDKGIVTIPITRAMQLEIAEISADASAATPPAPPPPPSAEAGADSDAGAPTTDAEAKDGKAKGGKDGKAQDGKAKDGKGEGGAAPGTAPKTP